jgi:hypothetical protein
VRKQSSSVHLLQEEVVDLLPDECPQSQELSVDPVQHSLEEVPFARVLAVKQLKKLKDEFLVYDLLADGRLEVGRFQEAEKEFVDQLQRERGCYRETKTTMHDLIRGTNAAAGHK